MGQAAGIDDEGAQWDRLVGQAVKEQSSDAGQWNRLLREDDGAGCRGRLMRQAGGTGWWDRLLKDSQVVQASGTG